MIENFKVLEALNITGGWSWIGNSYDDLIFHDKSKTKPTEEAFNAKKKELEDEYKKNKYQRDRKSEYPSIEELVVALYDATDKVEVDKLRAEVKKKYPKPSE